VKLAFTIVPGQLIKGALASAKSMRPVYCSWALSASMVLACRELVRNKLRAETKAPAEILVNMEIIRDKSNRE